MQSIEPRAINNELVTAAENEEEIINNAKYAISIARKLGAAVFLVWEHIKDVLFHFLNKIDNSSFS